MGIGGIRSTIWALINKIYEKFNPNCENDLPKENS